MEHPLTTYITADTIISALGFGTQENLQALRAYRSGIALHTDQRIAHTPIHAAAISQPLLQQRAAAAGLDGYSRMEQLFILAVEEVLQQSGETLEDETCGLILSTTKGNIDLLATHTDNPDDAVYLWKMADTVAAHFHASPRVHLISNACISGVSALIVGKRMIESGTYRKVVVAGGDILSHFITSGFLSFRSVSSRRCRPYDSRRNGLNLGEACGAVMIGAEGTEKDIILSGGAVSNDANHISGPSRTGDGLYFAIRQAMHEAGTRAEDISFINAHGTATVFNDEMESKAITLAHLEQVPVHSLKPYFGHTLGASGIIESIIAMHELKEGLLFATLGYETMGVPMPLRIYAAHREIPMKHCIKTASGFGGCNAAIVLSLPPYRKESAATPLPAIRSVRKVCIEQSRVCLDDKTVFQSEEPDFGTFIREAYKKLGGNNLKFYKMDDLCKLGYIAAGYLLEGKTFAPQEIAILLANASSSLHTDIRHQQLIDQNGDEAASPALFVYTLPNVVSGEICIRHKIQGENTFFITQTYQPEKLEEYARIVMGKGNLKYGITGWCDLMGDTYKAEFKLIENKNMEELIEELKAELIEALNLEEITPGDIDTEAPLFGDDGLGLDSIDALEIILILERNYGIKIENPSKGKEIFYSVRTLADYITAHRKG